MTEVQYNTSKWSDDQIKALDEAAKGIASIDKQETGVTIVTALDFVPLFRRMSENLNMNNFTTAVLEPKIINTVPAELPKKRITLR